MKMISLILTIGILIGFILIPAATTTITYAPSSKYAASSKDKNKGDLTVIVKLKYSKVIDSNPQLYKKVRLTIGDDEYYKYHDLSDKPDSIKVKNLDIDVGEKFQVHLNNPRTDDGEQAKGVNHKDKKPEVISIKVP